MFLQRNWHFFPLIINNSFFCCLGLMAGIVFAALSCELYNYHVFLVFGLPGFLLYKKKRLVLFALVATTFLVGAASYSWNKKHLSFLPLTNKPFQALVQEKKKTGNYHWPYRLRLKTKRSPSFFMYLKKTPAISVDDVIECAPLKVKRPSEKDFQNYLYKEGASGTVFLVELNATILKHPSFSFARLIDTKKNFLADSLKEKMSPACFAFFSSLFLGERNEQKQFLEKCKRDFRLWGISHHLARSGLHLMIFVCVWLFLMNFLPLSFGYKNAFIVALCFLYFLLTPTSISFLRALSLFFLYQLCSLCNWQMNPVHLISCVCFVTLVLNPFQLFFLDFQLSFFLTFCLAWLAHLLRQKKQLT